MKLHDMKPAEGARKARKRVGRGIGSGQVKLPVEVMTVKTLVPAAVSVLDSRVVKFHFSNDFRSVDLRTLIVKNMQS